MLIWCPLVAFMRMCCDRNTVFLSVVLVITPLSASAASWWDTGKELPRWQHGNMRENRCAGQWAGRALQR